jgi:hypothetical protein
LFYFLKEGKIFLAVLPVPGLEELLVPNSIRAVFYFLNEGKIFLAVLPVPGMEELPNSILAFSSSPGAYKHKAINFSTRKKAN